MYTTHEQIFEDCIKALASRGWTRSTKYSPYFQENVACCYSSPGCAIGVLKGVDKYAKEWDNGGSLEIYSVCEVYREEFYKIFSGLIHLDFLSGLQKAHDTGRNPETMKRNFRSVMIFWGLEISEEIHDLLA